jgi:DNA-binding IclR family transcriptional regulator
MKANMYRKYLQIFAAVSCFLKPGGITIAESAKELQVSRSTANRLKRSMEDELGYNF